MMYTVLGASGFIGRRLVQMLKARGEEVFAPARNDINVFSKNLGKVFYCVGMTADFLKNPTSTFEAHTELLVRLLASAKFERLVYLSSTRLYDGLKNGNEDAIFELSPTHFRHLYDLTKILGEHFTLLHSGGRGCVARLACVYDAAPDATGFLPELLSRLPNERRIVLNSIPEIARDYIYIDDVINSLFQIMKSGDAGWVYNVASGRNVSNADIVQYLRQAGWDIALQGLSGTPLPSPKISVERLMALGIQPQSLMDFFATYLKKTPCPFN